MRIPVCFVVLPTARLQEISRKHLGVEYFEGEVWTTSQRHMRYEHSREQVEQATWNNLLAFCDLDELADPDHGEKAFLAECLQLGFSECFIVHETALPAPAADLIQQAEQLKPCREKNLATLREIG
jgi:hypothetical protein